MNLEDDNCKVSVNIRCNLLLKAEERHSKLLYYHITGSTIENTMAVLTSELILPCIQVVNEVPKNGSWCYEYGQHSAALTALSERNISMEI
jgi:hypothetical protein